MACNGHSNSCPSHPGYDPPVEAVSWTTDPLDTNDEVDATHFNELKYWTTVEYSRRSISPSGGFPPDDKDTDDIIYGSDYITVWDHIKNIDRTWSPTQGSTRPDLKAGQDIQDESTEDMRDQIDTLRAECLCNCNYSCTCNCNYCTCNCNYSCTCNCNYSDERLKIDIVYL